MYHSCFLRKIHGTFLIWKSPTLWIVYKKYICFHSVTTDFPILIEHMPYIYFIRVIYKNSLISDQFFPNGTSH